MQKILFIASLLLLLTDCSKKSNGYYSDGSVGASANDFLSAASYSSLKIEILYMPGYAPDAGALSHLQALLGSILNKPSGIQIIQRQISSGNKNAYSLTDIKKIEMKNRTAYAQNTTLAVCMLITDGNYTDNRVLGISYRNTSFALFGKTIYENSGGIGQASRTKLEATVAEHEFGHLLGLVNIGSDMQTNHEDAAHINHCDDTNCLMYYAAETTDILGFLITGSIPQLDANCQNDLKANGGK